MPRLVTVVDAMRSKMNWDFTVKTGTATKAASTTASTSGCPMLSRSKTDMIFKVVRKMHCQMDRLPLSEIVRLAVAALPKKSVQLAPQNPQTQAGSTARPRDCPRIAHLLAHQEQLIQAKQG